MKNFLILVTLLLAACASAPTKPINADLPSHGDKMNVIVSNQDIVISIDTDKVSTEGDVKLFSALMLIGPSQVKNGPTAIVSRVALNCKTSTVKQVRVYQLDAKGTVIATKVFETDFNSISKDSLGEKAYPVVCGKPFSAPETSVTI